MVRKLAALNPPPRLIMGPGPLMADPRVSVLLVNIHGGGLTRCDTVAEGIEVEAQRETLVRLGCHTGQGYVFARPMPIGEVLEAAVTRRRNVLAGNIEGNVGFSATGRFRGI